MMAVSIIPTGSIPDFCELRHIRSTSPIRGSLVAGPLDAEQFLPRTREPMPDFAAQNLFEMFVGNDCRPGFWLRRTTWVNSCALVVSVGPFSGPAPYYGNPKVHADIFDLTAGELREANARLPAAGTYKTWRLIDAAKWAADS